MTDGRGTLVGVRLSHDVADVDALEAARADEVDVLGTVLDSPGVSEAFALATCNRIEAYAVADDETAGFRALSETPIAGRSECVRMDQTTCLEHLLRVAAGLESLVVGEDEILGQVERGYETARSVDAVGPVLETVVTKAIRVGKRARTETAINEGAGSVATAATDLLGREAPLAGATALVVGAGRMGAAAARALASSAADTLVVANRTPERARLVCEDLTAQASPASLSDLDGLLDEADTVVTATASPDPVVDEDTVAGAGETFFVDIAQPRDVSPAVADHPSCRVATLDDFDAVSESIRDRRREAVREVEALVTDAVPDLRTQLRRRRVDGAIATLYGDAERVKQRQVEVALERLDASGGLDADERDVVESLADALVSRLLADPTAALRRAAAEDDPERVAALTRLFELDDRRDADPGSEEPVHQSLGRIVDD
ncbi:glutamyl-tRNA reductase [Haloarculaceae archaeon H-GB1-1]|nr:glutamyl-tRNA reductase [Haloarculaceae archaeon H-GB1-1]